MGTRGTSTRFQGGEGSIQRVLALGTGAVSTATFIVGSMNKHGRVGSIRFYGQATVTATSLTAEVFARTSAGASGISLQSAATDITFDSGALAKTGVAAALANAALSLREDQLLEVVITADTCSAGPGDLLVEIGFEPRV